jgi:RNA polymerase sigma-70 factor (ECF subfamily)
MTGVSTANETTTETGDGPSRPDTDQAMDRYAEGDDQAFGVVYDAVAPRLAGYVRRQVRDVERAADIVQQTFLQMHRARATFIRGSAALPWAFAIARRLIIDGARQRRVRPDPEPLPLAPLADPTTDGEDQLLSHEAARQLAAELDRIPPLQRQAFELTKQEGLSLKQAAHVLGTTIGAVKLRTHRAVIALRSALERESLP